MIPSDPDPANPPTIFLSAGEPSGDLHGASLARSLRKQIPGVRLIGLGGPRMAAQGVELLAGLDDLAVMGFVEVLAHLPFFLRLRKQVFGALRDERVDLVIPIDYPGFNLRLARHSTSRLGIPVLYYVAPQVWAWHKSRARDLAEYTDRIAVILPFEEKFLRANGAESEFVGHPLLDQPPDLLPEEEWRRVEGIGAHSPVLGLFPGSRVQEVRRHLEIFLESAERLRAELPDLEPVVGAPEHIDRSIYRGSSATVTTRTGELLKYSAAALVKSGTTTLEAALAGTPFVVAYRMNALSYQLAKRVVDVPHIALANLVADRRIVPELIQEEVNPERLAAELRPLVDPESEERRVMLTGLERVRDRLERGGAADRVAEIAAEMLSAAAERR